MTATTEKKELMDQALDHLASLPTVKPDAEKPMVFDIVLEDGTTVRVQFERNSLGSNSHFEFWGEISETGYRSHYASKIVAGDADDVKASALQYATALRKDFISARMAAERKARRAESKGKPGRKKAEKQEVADQAETVASETPATESTEAAPAEPPVEPPPSDPAADEPAGGEEEDKPHIETQTYTKHLKCFLTEEEKRDAASALVQRMEDLSRKEAELESIKNQFKGEKSRIEADIEANKNLVRDGYVFREINCRETKNFETERLEIVRLDTMETIEDRRLHNHELQMTLPGMA